MLLGIDAGNTNTVFALFEGDRIRARWRLRTDERRTADEYRIELAALFRLDGFDTADVKHVIISSVVPPTLRPLRELCKLCFRLDPLVVGENDFDSPIPIKIDTPSELGADRIVNAMAAYKSYGAPCYIVDFGTATTFDVIGKGGAYLGGVIAPGVNLSLRALYKAAAKLPKVSPEPPRTGKATGKGTVQAMQSGIFYGYLSLIEGIIARLKDENGDGRVIATGGLAPVFAPHSAVIDEIDQDLTVRGLYLLHKHFTDT